jgi:metallo-beta-lactamase family protein
MDIVPTTAAHSLPDGELWLLGAVETVTGACTRVEIGGRRLLIDCGVAQGDEARTWRFPDAARDVDTVVLTHGHLDHVGSLPALLEGGWSGGIVGTRATLALASVVIRDSVRIAGASEDDADGIVRQLARMFRPLPYDAAHDLGGVTVAFREAGHILGSASAELRSAASRVVLSGDLGRPDTPILRTYNRRWDPGPVDLVVMETTYGDRDHAADHSAIQGELRRILDRALARRGKVLVPAFAIGRTQLLLYHLNALVEAGHVDVPVLVDSPMGLSVTELYNRSRELYDEDARGLLAAGDHPLDFSGLYAVRRASDSERVREMDGPAILIASSGMCTGGRIVAHLQELLPLEETCVLFVGFQAPGTPGRAILDAGRRRAQRGGVPTVRLDGREVDVRAAVEYLPGLSAHADRGELRDWLSALPEVRRVALHHGEHAAQHAFATWCCGSGPASGGPAEGRPEGG